MHLSQIKSPGDIRSLSYSECEVLAEEIRDKILSTVSSNGGHLASNLGIVEMTIALHRVFDTPTDKIVFDVGHQTYAHKLLTGRYDSFHTIRTYNGLSGFPRRNESEYDCFETGHASTSVSAALGYARARDLQNENHHVVAVIGDGALTGGLAYEALNDCGNKKTRMIVLLNDNGMSIAKNVGALSKHLYQLRASATWHNAKTKVKNRLTKLPVLGTAFYYSIHWIKGIIKNIFLNEGFFTSLGFHYLGPVDGNDIEAVEKLLRKAKTMDEPVLIHCVTKKGRGYELAETEPEFFHGTKPFCVEDGKANTSEKAGIAPGKVANDHLCELAKTNPSIVVITAAMPLGCATNIFKANYPKRFFDVGIAEEHAVTLSAGMASGGLRPFFFVYSTFLQRGYDELLNDVGLQNLPAVFMLDHAGLCDEDGQTHHGIYDIAYLLSIPNMTILAPSNGSELKDMLNAVLAQNGPAAIRYPKRFETCTDENGDAEYRIGKWKQCTTGADGTILAVGSMVQTAIDAAAALRQCYQISLRVVNALSVRPLDKEMLAVIMSEDKPVFTLEEHAVTGGFGSYVLQYLCANAYTGPVHCIGIEGIIQHGKHEQLLREAGLDVPSVVERIRSFYCSVKEK